MSFRVFARHGGSRRSINVARLRKSEIDFLWIQLEDVIEHGKNKDAKTKLELLERIYQFLANAVPKSKQRRRR
jgi:2,3-bisphosphoglycerate-independent phosphoglycerate mutase